MEHSSEGTETEFQHYSFTWDTRLSTFSAQISNMWPVVLINDVKKLHYKCLNELHIWPDLCFRDRRVWGGVSDDAYKQCMSVLHVMHMFRQHKFSLYEISDLATWQKSLRQIYCELGGNLQSWRFNKIHKLFLLKWSKRLYTVSWQHILFSITL